jgi:YHS domain-containing protein
MERKLFTLLSTTAALCVVGIAVAQDMPGMKMPASPPPTSRPSGAPMSAIDLRNTVCPVTGDKTTESKLVEVFDGKVYHLCCSDCPKDFEKDPTKFAKAVAADPAKYGMK